MMWKNTMYNSARGAAAAGAAAGAAFFAMLNRSPNAACVVCGMVSTRAKDAFVYEREGMI